MNNVIYKISFENHTQFYIGSAVDFGNRKRQHIHYLIKNKHQNIYLQRIYNKGDKMKFEILDRCENKEDLISLEQRYLDDLKPEINILKKADSRLGSKHSEQTKNKMKGRVVSSETREKMSENRLGKKTSEITKKKISISLLKISGGKGYKFDCLCCGEKVETSEKNKKYCSMTCANKMSLGKESWNKGIACREETKQKLRLKLSGQKSPVAKLTNKDILLIKNKRDSGVSVINIAKQFNVDRSTIYSILKGQSYAI